MKVGVGRSVSKVRKGLVKDICYGFWDLVFV